MYHKLLLASSSPSPDGWKNHSLALNETLNLKMLDKINISLKTF